MKPSLSLAGLMTSLLATVAAADCSFWMEDIAHQGVAAFNDVADYVVWRNVKDFGAKGDGVTDDTAAIQAAISANGTFASSSATISTTTPHTVYFPAGTYVISAGLQMHFATHLVGNPNCMPVVKASSSFLDNGADFSYMVDADYGGKWSDTVLFYGQVRNLVLDSTAADASANLCVLHWPASQATALQNLVLQMAVGSNHVGLIMPGGSGGYLGDMVVNGGRVGMSLGNEQFTVRNVTFNHVTEAIHQAWNWGLTYLGVGIHNCAVGIRVADVARVCSLLFVDSVMTNTPLAIVTPYLPTGTIKASAVVLENAVFTNVTTVVQDGAGDALLAGAAGAGTKTVAGWAIGRSYTGATGSTLAGSSITPNTRPSVLTAAGQSSSGLVSGAYFSMSKPLYADQPASAFLSARDSGAKGDGVTDDTAALQHTINAALANGQIAFIDAGVYLVKNTITIPAGARVVGENFATIMSHGTYFANYAVPKPVVQVGWPGTTGTVYWSDMLVQVQGAQPGAILVQWNLASPAGAPSGMWDVHGRTGGTSGTGLLAAECPKVTATQVNSSNIKDGCKAAYAQMHITKAAAGVYLENVWFWGSDVDLDRAYTSSPQNLIYTARGLLVEAAAGPVWLLAAQFEHCVLYNYQFAHAAHVFASQLQSETPYSQPNPPAMLPFATVSSIHDPVFAANSTHTSASGATMPDAVAWGCRVVNSSDIYIYGAGHYSLHTDWMNGCGDDGRCQARLVSLEHSDVHYYDLHIVGADIMVAIDGTDAITRAANLVDGVGEVAVFHSS